MITSSNGIVYPVWDFNDVDVSAARDGANKYYFRASLGLYNTPSSVWSHGADARTYFPQPDRPSAGCELGQTPPAAEWGVHTLVVAPGRPGPLYALMTRPEGEGQAQRLFASRDGGANWQPFEGSLYGFKGMWFTFRRASADISIPADQRYWEPLPCDRPFSPGGWTIDGATGDIYTMFGAQPTASSGSHQLWRIHNPSTPNVADIAWELVHDFGQENQARLLGSGSGPRGMALYALVGPAPFCPGGVCLPTPPLTLRRSLDGGRTWTPLPQPTP